MLTKKLPSTKGFISEMEWDSMVIPTMSSDCLLSLEKNFHQRISLIRKWENAEAKKSSQTGQNNNSLVIKQSHGLLVPTQGL